MTKPGQSPGDDRTKDPYDKNWPPPAPLKKPKILAKKHVVNDVNA